MVAVRKTLFQWLYHLEANKKVLLPNLKQNFADQLKILEDSSSTHPTTEIDQMSFRLLQEGYAENKIITK
jgi:hypothetical protein